MWSSPAAQPRPRGSFPLPPGQPPHQPLQASQQQQQQQQQQPPPPQQQQQQQHNHYQPVGPYPPSPYAHVPYSRVPYPHGGGGGGGGGYPGAPYAMHGHPYSPRPAYQLRPPMSQQQSMPKLTNSNGPPTLEPQATVASGPATNGAVPNSAYTASPISSAKDNDSNTLPPGSPASTSFHDDDNSMISSPSTPAVAAAPVNNNYPLHHQYGPVNAMHRLLELGSEPDRRAWAEKYLQFMEERGKPLANLPQVAKQPLDLYRLYVGVKERGGVLEVVRTKKWKEVSQFIHINASASAAYTLRRNYTKFLIDFEYQFDRDGADPLPAVQEIEAMTKKKTSAKVKEAAANPGQLIKGEDSVNSGRSTPHQVNGCYQPDYFHHQQQQQNGPHFHPAFHPQHPGLHFGQPNGQAGQSAAYTMHHHPPAAVAAYQQRQQQQPSLGSSSGPPEVNGVGVQVDGVGAACNSSHQLTKLEHMVSSHQPTQQPQLSRQQQQQQTDKAPHQKQQKHQQTPTRPPPPPPPQFAQQMGPPIPQQHMGHHGQYQLQHQHYLHYHQHYLQRPAIILDPKTVEGVEPKLKHRALTQKDVGPVDLWRVLMALRSGLLVEVTWALNVLNVLLADSATRDYFALPRLAGLFDSLVDVWRRLLIDLRAFDTDENMNLLDLEADGLCKPIDKVNGICFTSRHVRSCLKRPQSPQARRKRKSSMSSNSSEKLEGRADEPVFVTESEEDRNQLRLRCRSVLNVIRSLSFLPNNEPIIGNHIGFLRIGAALLNTSGDSLPYDVDDLLVIFSNVAGHVGLERLPECVCRPLLSVLLRRLREENWFGFACESLAKMCVRPENVDLLLATPDSCQLGDTLELLCSKLKQRDQIERELALALLSYLLSHADNWAVCELAASCCSNPVRSVLDFLEQVESQAVHICQQYGVQALHEHPDLLRQAPGIVSLDLLQRATRALRCVAERGGQAALDSFAREEDRLLMLCMSSVLQPALTEPLADCLRHLSAET